MIYLFSFLTTEEKRKIMIIDSNDEVDACDIASKLALKEYGAMRGTVVLDTILDKKEDLIIVD